MSQKVKADYDSLRRMHLLCQCVHQEARRDVGWGQGVGRKDSTCTPINRTQNRQCLGYKLRIKTERLPIEGQHGTNEERLPARAQR